MFNGVEFSEGMYPRGGEGFYEEIFQGGGISIALAYGCTVSWLKCAIMECHISRSCAIRTSLATVALPGLP